MSLENKNILVTGGAGFIGSNIIEYLLQKDNKITCLDNLITDSFTPPNEFMTIMVGTLCRI